MNHLPGQKHAPGGNNRLTGGAAADLFAFLEYGRSARTVNRPVDAAAAQQTAVGGIDNGINLLKGNIPLYQFKRGAGDLYFHRYSPFCCNGS
jgi:hypothetical protein